MILRCRCALRLVAAVAFCLPLTACDDKKHSPAIGGVQADRLSIPNGRLDARLEGNHNTENYQHFVENAYLSAEREPMSTFSASVDTAAYSIVRSKIHSGQLPPKDAVRIADLLNYFDYDYPRPSGEAPVAAMLEMAPCPWNAKHHLLRIALAAKTFRPEEMPPRNLVFLIDTSGSMSPPDRLPLVKQSLNLLVETLRPEDRVSIVTYAGDA
jgi:Ca-activated chloride channel family protein